MEPTLENPVGAETFCFSRAAMAETMTTDRDTVPRWNRDEHYVRVYHGHAAVLPCGDPLAWGECKRLEWSYGVLIDEEDDADAED